MTDEDEEEFDTPKIVWDNPDDTEESCGEPDDDGLTPCQRHNPLSHVSIENMSKYLDNAEHRYQFEFALTQATMNGLDSKELAELVVDRLGREPVIEAMEKMVKELKEEDSEDE